MYACQHGRVWPDLYMPGEAVEVEVSFFAPFGVRLTCGKGTPVVFFSFGGQHDGEFRGGMLQNRGKKRLDMKDADDKTTKVPTGKERNTDQEAIPIRD
jgi:hypothetical protein